MGFSIRVKCLVRSRECVRFTECPLREVLLYYYTHTTKGEKRIREENRKENKVEHMIL